MPNLAQRFEAADRLLMHWHEQALGKPGHWGSLAFSDASVPEMLRRVEVARATGGAHAGTAQLADLLKFAEELRSAHGIAPRAETGPSEEKWAHAPGVTPEDVATAEEWLKEHASSSPVHLVAEQARDARLEDEMLARAIATDRSGTPGPSDSDAGIEVDEDEPSKE